MQISSELCRNLVFFRDIRKYLLPNNVLGDMFLLICDYTTFFILSRLFQSKVLFSATAVINDVGRIPGRDDYEKYGIVPYSYRSPGLPTFNGVLMVDEDDL